MNQALYNKVSQALSYSPSAQPIHADVKVDDQPANGVKANSKAGMGNTKLRNRGAFNPNKSYPVAIINKAQAKMGGR